MKKRHIIAWLKLMAVFYLMVAFSKWQINASLWYSHERFVYAFFGGAMSATISSFLPRKKANRPE